jgi:ABC-type sulfate/molybdate transport systems ATPase subunit
MLLGDRVLVMNEGLIEQLGPPDEIRDSPATPYVAQLTERAQREY